MRRLANSPLAWLLGFLVFSLLLFLISSGQSRSESEKSAIITSDAPAGLSLFYELKNHLKPQSASVTRRPFLDPRSLEKIDTLMILAPRRPVTEHEADVIAKAVDHGLYLIISAPSRDSFRFVSSVLLATRTPLPSLSEDEKFINAQPISVKGSETQTVFSEQETYSFYSAFKLNAGDTFCELEKRYCYWREFTYGSGKIAVIAGLAPFSNGLIRLENNSTLASRLALLSGHILFDEYHQLFSEKTWFDFFTDPAFAGPLLGLIIGTLLFFTLAYHPFYELNRSAPKAGSRRSYHQFNQQIVLYAMQKPGSLISAVFAHAESMLRLFPREKAAIEETLLPLRETQGRPTDETLRAIADRLLKLHQTILREKGRK